MKINLQENSTKRGFVWAIFAVLGCLGWWSGKDITPLMLLAGAVAGGMGIAQNDTK
jgi:hypothetical protein